MAGDGLRFVFDGQDGVGHWDFVVQSDAADACATAFPYDRARQKTFSEPELGQRRLTVYRFTGSDGSVRTVRVHGLAGVGAGAGGDKPV